MRNELIQGFEGYDDIINEIRVCRKYGIDYSVEKGSVQECINRLHPALLRLRVSDVIEETKSAKTFRLVSPNHYLPPFQAGQYLSLFFEIGAIRTYRPYSISSSPSQAGYYDITVKRVEDGLVSGHLLDHVSRGAILECSGPWGNFYHNPIFHDNTLVCIAGGSGITPFMSMILETIECGLDRKIYLFYGNKGPNDVLFDEKLAAIARRHENIHYIPVIEHPANGYAGAKGLITGRVIQEALGDVREKTFYLCGPRAMYDFCVDELARLGIPRKKIRKEVNGIPVHVSSQPGWPDEVGEDDVFNVQVRGGDTIKARAGEPLLVALEKHGLKVVSRCRSGECSMCRVKVLSGKVFQLPGSLLRKSDSKFGYIHACAAYPIDDVEILI